MIGQNKMLLLCFYLTISVIVSLRVSLSLEKQVQRFSTMLEFYKLKKIRSLIMVNSLDKVALFMNPFIHNLKYLAAISV